MGLGGKPVTKVTYDNGKGAVKQNEIRRRALLLKKAILTEKIKVQDEMYKSWIRRGR